MGAYYLAGYAVECALKACIAKQTQRHEFPKKSLANRAYTHDLGELLKLSGLEPEFKKEMKKNRALELNWAVVKDWKEQSRYETSVSRADANDLYSACVARKHGILSWIRKKW